MKKIFTTLAILLTVHFSRACYADYTYTNGCVGDTVFFHALDGFAAYTWDYGDTTAGVANVSHDVLGYHVYSAPGIYYVTLFVNIGAEWAYRTSAIHIGNTCFQAGFTTQCSPTPLYVTFSDLSYGTHTFYHWNFGDPASGTANNDTSLTPVHHFTSEGNYVITYIIGQGAQFDTLHQSIYVDSTCYSVVLPDLTASLSCVGDTMDLHYYIEPHITYTHWNFGDPASGNANTSTLPYPKHLFSGVGNYLVTLVYGDGIIFDTVQKMFPVVDCSVWPGDANSDGEVNGEDIFPIGLYYSSHGPQRSAASSNWSGQACNSWFETSSYGHIMYLQDFVDMQMADCNGDSTLNELDVATIQTNYGRKHLNKNNRSAMLFHTSSDPTLLAQLTNSTVNAGDDIVVNISLGSAAHPSGYTYGGSFTLLYDPTKVDANAQVTFDLGWLDSTGNSMIKFYHETYNEGKLEIAFVKTNHVSETGYGPVATVTFHTKSTASGVFPLQFDGTAKIFNLTLGNTGSSGNMEVFRNMNLFANSGTIVNTSGIMDMNTSSISIYPNPSNGLLFVQHSKLNDALQFEMFNVLGEKVLTRPLTGGNKTESVQLTGIAPGLYCVAVKNAEGQVIESKKILITQ